MEIIEKINCLNLKGLERVKCGDAVIAIENRLKKDISRSKLISILLIIKYSFIQRTVIDYKKGKEKIAFLLSNSYGSRKDYHHIFDKVVSTCDDRIVFRLTKTLSFKYWYLIIYTFQWYKELRKVFNKEKATYLVAELYVDYIDARIIVDLLRKEKCGFLVVFCDFHPIDSLVVQMCKRFKIKTATLQHGHFSVGSIAFKYSHSDYFLGYGQYTYDVARKSGYDCRRFIEVGMPHLIDSEVTYSVIHNDMKVFTVILDSVAVEDVELLDISYYFVKQYGYRRIIKLHPGHGYLKAYENHIKDEDIVIVNEETVTDLLNKSRFAVIAGGSTVFMEYMVHLFPSFLFSKYNHRFSGFEWCEFEDVEHLCNLFEKMETRELDSLIIKSRDIISNLKDVRNSYKHFFESIM